MKCKSCLGAKINCSACGGTGKAWPEMTRGGTIALIWFSVAFCLVLGLALVWVLLQ